ncbi:MAG: TlpA family protein disulfide reductase [Thiobacillus sp.]|nr:TlpA family protein disulfide reductase [Thiobacillus sp.]
MIPTWRIALPLALAALAAGVWVAHQHYAPRTAERAASAALWQTAYPDSRGRTQPLAQWRGKLVVVNFWASWCAPCREEMPDFDALRRQFHTRGVEIVGIAIDTPANVGSFLARQPVAYPILVGEGSAHTLVRQLGNPAGALPYTIVLDRDGKLVYSHLGRLPRATLNSILHKFGA